MEESHYLGELLKCVRCGSCKAFCPTYHEGLTEAMGARGRLVLLWGLHTGELKPSKILQDHIFSCILCGACTETCPSGVDVPEAIYHSRRLLRRSDRERRYLRLFTKLSFKQPELSFRLLRMGQHILLPYLIKKGILPFPLEIPEVNLKKGHQVYGASNKRGRVALFTGCMINFLFPSLGWSLIHVLRALDYEVILPAGEVCCGTPLRTIGLEEEAKELARKNLEIFNRLKVEAVLSLCPTCTLALKREYPKLIGGGIEKAMDISSFLLDKIDVPPARIHQLSLSALYHDPCHLKYGLGIKKEPREIMKKIGIDVSKTEGERCCGFGGIFSLSNKDLSQGILEKCISEYAETEAEAIVTSCPGCLLQLRRGIYNKPVFHLIEIIAEAYLGSKI